MSPAAIDHAERLARLRARMAETGTDVLAVGPTSNMAWLSGLDPHGDERPVMQVVTQDFAGFLMPALNVDSQRGLTDLPFFPWSDAEGPADALRALLSAAGALGRPVSLALDEAMRADFALLLIDALEVSRRGFLGETLSHLRMRKDAAEFARLKENALINDRAMQAAFAGLRRGMRETDVADLVRDSYAREGAEAAFISICFGPNGAFPHHHTGTTALEPETAVLIDIGSRKDGYPSDMTRVGWFGAAPSADFLRVHAVVDAAVAAALEAARPGAPARAVDAAARGVITAAGHGPQFLHRTGHGLGIDVHEAPYMTATSETVMEPGMVFSIEPGIYLAGAFGLRLEEIVILREDGPEILSELSRAPIVTPA